MGKRFKHGHAGSGKHSKTYNTWIDMKRRCINPKRDNFKNYGGRGISICDRWNKFENFLEDMGAAPDGLTIERKDNNGNYTPENCYWATWRQQNRNNRRIKLNPFKVQLIKKLLKESQLTQKEIGKIFNVCHSIISAIKLNRKWKYEH